MKDLPRFVSVKLLQDPSIARYFDIVGHVVTARQVLLLLEGLAVELMTVVDLIVEAVEVALEVVVVVALGVVVLGGLVGFGVVVIGGVFVVGGIVVSLGGIVVGLGGVVGGLGGVVGLGDVGLGVDTLRDCRRSALASLILC